jgi:hypothetical protein
LNRTEQDAATEATAKSTLRTEVLKRVAMGGGWSIGGAVVWGVIELLKSEPNQAFPLLKSWGPWAIFALVALYVIYDLSRLLLGIGLRAVVALESLSVAQQKSADKDDRQLQEIQTLTAYTSQQSERTADSMRSLHEKLDVLIQAKGEPK